MEISQRDPRTARTFPRWRLWSLLVGVLLLIIGFVTFLPTIGQGDGEIPLFAMALGAVIVLLVLTVILISLVLRYVKARV